MTLQLSFRSATATVPCASLTAAKREVRSRALRRPSTLTKAVLYNGLTSVVARWTPAAGWTRTAA